MSSTRETRHVVAPAAELPPGARKVVSVNGHEIGIFNVEGTFYAILNYCPHRAGPLCQGRTRPLVTSPGVYQREYEREGQILKCPWHQWEFDLATGQALYDEKLRVRTYRAAQEVEDVVLFV